MHKGIIISSQEAQDAKDAVWRAYETGLIEATAAAEVAVDIESRAVPVNR